MPGRMDEAKGAVKEGVGKTLGNEQMEAEGKAQRLKAKGARESAGAGNVAAGKVKEEVGDLLDNEQMEAEGKAQRLKGKTQQAG
jgi:uncharacterized protein YjbJ (UPF0337 family)